MTKVKRPIGANIIGLTVRDRITRHVGIAIGYAEYLTGNAQVMVEEPDTTKPAEPRWLDIERVEWDESKPRIRRSRFALGGPA